MVSVAIDGQPLQPLQPLPHDRSIRYLGIHACFDGN
jgi:hypothetical protein